MAALSPALVLFASDIDATRRYYEAIGMTFRTERHGKGPEHHVCDFGGFVLEIYQPQHRFMMGVRGPCRHIQLVIPVTDIPAAVRALEARGAIVESRITSNGLIACSVDPDEVQIMLIQS